MNLGSEILHALVGVPRLNRNAVSEGMPYKIVFAQYSADDCVMSSRFSCRVCVMGQNVT